MIVSSNDFDLIIIGGGVVGLSILRAATLAGWKCALVERESHLLSRASGHNSGIICTGVDAEMGTLERALVRDSISCIRQFCKVMNVPIRPSGSLVCEWGWDHQSTNCDPGDRLENVLYENHIAGDTHASKLTPRQVHEIEPNLNVDCLGAVHIPGEIVVDPWLYCIALATHARENGATIITDFEFDYEQSTWDGSHWIVVRKGDMIGQSSTLKARAVVNAAGLWSAQIHSNAVQERAKWSARPRRGQYRIYSSNEWTRIHHPIQPIPTQRTKGIFVFSSLYDQILVGPTALDQESHTDCTLDPAVAEQLDATVRRVLPRIHIEKDHIGDYVGIRPGTDQRDYQVHVNYPKHWVSVAGVRSTGLTASLGIGRHTAQLLQNILVQPKSPSLIQTTPLPKLHTLIESFKKRDDGTVEIHGHSYMVTHPITRYGWTAQNGWATSKC